MLPTDAPLKEQFTLKHYQPTNRAQPLASYFPERVPEEIEEIAEELPENNTELPPTPTAKNKFFPNLFKLLALFTVIASVVATIVFIYRRENARTLARQFNRTLAGSLIAIDASLARVDAALADLLLATKKTALPDSALATDKAVKTGKIAVIQSWQNLDSLKQLILDTPGRKVAASLTEVPALSPLSVRSAPLGSIRHCEESATRQSLYPFNEPASGPAGEFSPLASLLGIRSAYAAVTPPTSTVATAAGEISDLIPPTETYLTETQKAFGYFEQFSALQQKAADILTAAASYQNNPGTDTGLNATSLNNFAADLTALKAALRDLNDNLPFALTSFHEENLRSLTTWLSLLGTVNAAVYENDPARTSTAVGQLAASLNSWATQSRNLSTEFFRANKTLQKYFYLAPLYQSTLASLQLLPY